MLSFRNTAATAAAQHVTETVQARAWLVWQYSSASRQITLAVGVVIICVGMACGQDAAAATDSKKVQEALEAIRNVQINGGNHAEAQAAVKVLGGLPSTELPAILNAFEGASPLAKNWLMGVAGSLVRQADKIPVAPLEAFLSDTKNDVDARYWAFELLTQQDAAARNKWLAAMTEDPCLEIRYLAVAQKLEQLDAAAVDAAAYRRLLDQARHPEQLKAITAKLRDAGEGVDLARQYGFVMAWDLIGPFDNRGEKGFDIAYDPEKAYLANPAARPTGPYLGKEGVTCNWVPLTTVADDGLLDVAPVYNKEKGAIAYAFAEFQADDAVPADIRLGCINANKVWVNGREISSNQIYHASSSIDQYIGKVELKKGSNTIFIKICQNEMTQAWAQDWSFQLRVCDATGKAILASGRPVVAVKKTEAKADEQK